MVLRGLGTADDEPRRGSWRQHGEGNRTAVVAATATERVAAVRELILARTAMGCIRVCLCRRRPCCCATACMATELSLTAVACGEDGIFALPTQKLLGSSRIASFGGSCDGSQRFDQI